MKILGKNFPDDKRQANFETIIATPENTGDGRWCDYLQLIPGLRQLGELGTRATTVELECLAHFASYSTNAEISMVCPTAIKMAFTDRFEFPDPLRDEFQIVAAQELAHGKRYGRDVLRVVHTHLRYAPAAASVGYEAPPPTMLTLEQIADYVVSEATASGTLFGDHRSLSTYSKAVLGGHSKDELIHNRVALDVNHCLVQQLRADQLEVYLGALLAAIRRGWRPDERFVLELVRRLRLRGRAVDITRAVIEDPANLAAMAKSCKELVKDLEQLLPGPTWAWFRAGLPFDPASFLSDENQPLSA